MKPRHPLYLQLHIFALLFLSSILIGCASAPASSTINPAAISLIRVVMDNNYPPYAFLNENGEMQGIAIDQWRLWEQRTGVQVQITGLPWEEALEGMRIGEYDVIDTIFYTAERAQIFDYTEPYADIDVRIFFPKNVSGFGNADSLQGFHVAVKSGDANAEYLSRHNVTDLVYYNNYEEIVKAAADKKESIFVMDQPPALYFLYKYGAQDQFDYSEPLYGGKFHRAVKKGNKDLLALVNSGFEKISAAEYQEVNNRWFGVNPYAEVWEIAPYLILGAGITALAIAILFAFNRELRARVESRTRELETALANLKASEKRFREAVEFLPIPLGIADKNGNIIEYNRKFVEEYGYTIEDTPDIEGWMSKAYPDPEYRQRVAAQWDIDVQNAILENSPTPIREYKITGKDGRVHDVEITMRAVGNLWITAFHEITERKRAESALRKSENKHRLLFETANDSIFLMQGLKITDCNSYTLDMFGCPRELLVGKTPVDFSPEFQPDGQPSIEKAREKIETTLKGEPQFFEWQHQQLNGNLFDVEVRLNLLNMEDEVYIQAIVRDITERKQVEAKLRESKERYRTLFEDSPIPLIEEDFSELKEYIDQLRKNGVTDLRSYFTEHPTEAQRCPDMVQMIDVNKAAVQWYQARSKSEIQVSLGQLISKSARKGFIEEVLLLDNKRHYELSISRVDYTGSPLHIIVNGTIVPNYEETWGRVLVSIVDITKRKQVEDELAKQLELLRGLRAIDQAIITTFDLSANLNILLREILTQLRVDAASISLFGKQTLQFAAGQGFKTNAEEFSRHAAGSGLTARVARERQDIHIFNLQEMDYPSVPARAIKDEGFIAYHGVPLIVKGQLLGILEIFHRAYLKNGKDWLAFLDMLAGQAAITINSAALFNDLQTSNTNLRLAYDTTLEGWSRALDLRDEETEGHTRRVTDLTIELARKFGFNEVELIHIKRGSLLHDIGKMGIPDSILLKPAALTDAEWEIMRKHPIYAYELISPIEYLRPALDIPYYHHERWDGSGYPHGLKEEKIPLAARIFTVIDVWDALTSDRPYRAAWQPEKAKEHLREEAGVKFDPRVVDVFLKMMENKETTSQG